MSAFNGIIKGQVTLNDSPVEGAIVKCASSDLLYGNLGGDIIEHEDYILHIFTLTGITDYFIISKSLVADILIVGGGGGGSDWGGGGAGGLIFIPNYQVVKGATPIQVGVGGLKGESGQNSFFDNFIALGGGGAGLYANVGKDGGSGGGTRNANPGLGLQPTSSVNNPPIGYGNKGGPFAPDMSPWYGNGGGGSGSEPGNDRNGGLGLSEVTVGGITYNFRNLFGTHVGFINGEQTEFAGGGGGGSYHSSTGRLGMAGGGNGAVQGIGGSGQPSTGSGGGGAGNTVNNGGPGGTGVVIVRVKKLDGLVTVQHSTTTQSDGSYIFLGLGIEQKYNVSVEYEDLDVPSGHEGIKYNALNQWAIVPMTTLQRPQNLTEQSLVGTGNFKGLWNASVDATSYDVQISKTEDFSTGVSTFSTVNTHYDFDDLEEDIDLWWRVRAKADGKVTSEWSLVSHVIVGVYWNSGGTLIEVGDYTYHIFDEDEDFYAVTNGEIESALIIGGGGGGGGYGGGGGGAGGRRLLSDVSVQSGTVNPVRVGLGGVGNLDSQGGNGGTSSFNNEVVLGGGGGGAESANASTRNGASGASGGGGYGRAVYMNGTGGTGTAGQGSDGGTGHTGVSGTRPGGGGGGVGGAGETGVNGGHGGVGEDLSAIFGTSVGDNGWFCGGGGGGAKAGLGLGGSGGAGGGGAVDTEGVDGTGGGGGGGSTGAGKKGGRGVVILKCKTADFIL